MKFIHLSDLHIGKSIKNYSLIEDQKFILNEILDIIDEEKPDSVFISGDVYDKTVPSGEAVEVLNSFLKKLSDRELEIFLIYGNHDSAERLSFGNALMKDNVHFAKRFDGRLQNYKVKGVNVWLLPFVKPVHVREAFSDVENINGLIGTDYTNAVKYVLDRHNINTDEKNIILAHQFVTGASQSGSEDISSVGGLDNISADAFDKFDYVALGHIHRRQNIGNNIRYCGTPLKYSVSEAKDERMLTVGEIDENGLSVKEIPLKPMRDMKIITGTFDEVYNSPKSEDFVKITLTDTEVIYNAYNKIMNHTYPNIIEFGWENATGEGAVSVNDLDNVEEKSMFELFKQFYKDIMQTELSEEQEKIALNLCEKAEENVL